VNRTILVTGGAGYIGSHTVLSLLDAGHDVVIADNFSNSERWIPARIEDLAQRDVRVEEVDLRDAGQVDRLLKATRPVAVFHFGALKSVGDSLRQPLDYYQNNISGTLNLLQSMIVAGCERLVFSSSATVYGHPEHCPISEDAPLHAINPYGQTKLMMEQIIADVTQAHPGFKAAVLRYFNPAGAHPSGRLGELPRGAPSNLVPFVAQVAAGLRPEVNVYGSDYPTRDGTGVRDYIHVVDLAEAHVAALDCMTRTGEGLVVNLGTGRGFSVLEIVSAFEAACGHRIAYRLGERRPGDAAECFANPARANELLGWRARHGLATICADTWRWQQHLAQAQLPPQAAFNG